MATNQQTDETQTAERRDLTVLKQVQSVTADEGVSRAVFLPASMGEAMELAKLMANGNFVPAHLRNKPGDCLAVIMQSARWGMDPFAVANKTYFVNDRMAYEAQLVNAVLNSSGALAGRLDYEWSGQGDNLMCRVKGRLKADPRDKYLDQELKTITVRNSPLWKQSPKTQLGYYTARAWARLYAPEVLLGVYTPDELENIGPDNARPVGPTPPTRAQLANADARPEHIIEAKRHDAETGEVIKQDPPSEPSPQGDSAELSPTSAGPEAADNGGGDAPDDMAIVADELIAKINRAETIIDLQGVGTDHEAEVEQMPEPHKGRVLAAYDEREQQLKKGKK